MRSRCPGAALPLGLPSPRTVSSHLSCPSVSPIFNYFFGGAGGWVWTGVRGCGKEIFFLQRAKSPSSGCTTCCRTKRRSSGCRQTAAPRTAGTQQLRTRKCGGRGGGEDRAEPRAAQRTPASALAFARARWSVRSTRSGQRRSSESERERKRKGKSENTGLISADRSNKATLLLTIPGSKFKSSAKDLSLQHCNCTCRPTHALPRTPETADMTQGPKAYSCRLILGGQTSLLLAWILT